MKKLMLLGGSSYILPVIEEAHRLGLYVITCDYLPDNIAHNYADEYCNVSVVDRDAVLQKAKELQIDGIMSFACDPGVVTAAYVAEQMRLPFQCSYKAATILQDKGLFRNFLTKNGFNVPHAKRYTDTSEPMKDIDFFTWPVIVKPVDSAGSKAVTRVDDPKDLDAAIKEAAEGSHNGAFIIEDFLTFEGYHSSTDPFSIDGKLHFATYSDQLFDKSANNPYTPTQIIWPTSMKQEHQNYLTGEIQRLMNLLQVKTGIYNIETCVGRGGIPYIMEVSPRGGGCKIAELQHMAYGVDLIANEIRKAVGLPLLPIDPHALDGCWCEMVIHAGANQSGILKAVTIDSEIENKYVKLINIDMQPGELVEPFTGANKSLGNLFLRCDTREQMDDLIRREKEWLHIELE